ncbi:unnamed protein product [Orchesella dallaii]|uniref:ZZ-type domain-containing protein n=1 Tax=Orchesella dallaii TaxID=48710 RepID=A0ABP1RT35_9HEXA
MEGLKSFKCPTCLEIPEKEIFQCINGHSICHNCVANSPSNCPAPECGVLFRMGKVRNLALEALLDPIDFECVFKLVGCTHVCKRAELNEHIEGCQYSRQNVLLCKMIGYETCQFFPQVQTRAKILEHFRANHGDVIIQNGKGARIRLEDFVSVAEATEDYWWTPILINFENNESGPLFLILSSTNVNEKLTSWMCLLLWADKKENVENMFAEFSLQSAEDGIPELKWTLPAIPIQKSQAFLEECFPWKVRTDFLVRHYLSGIADGRSIVIKVAMMLREEPLLKVEKVEDDETTIIGSRGAVSGNPTRISDDSSSTTRSVTFGAITVIVCTGCKKTIFDGPIYKCLQCKDVDFCVQCITRNMHSHHVIALIRNPGQNLTFNNIKGCLQHPGSGIIIPSDVCKEEQTSTSRQANQAEPSTSRQANQAEPSTSRQASPQEPSTSCQASQAEPKPSTGHTLESRKSASESRHQIQNPTPSKKYVTRKRQTSTNSDYVFDSPVGAVCDGCKMEPLRGIHYKCAQCGNFDLCSECVQKGVHGNHIFLVLRNAVQQNKILSWYRVGRSIPKLAALLNKESDNIDSDDANVDSACEKCGKHCMKSDERLYRCLRCPGYFICSECFNEDQHPHKHIFAMTRSLIQWKILDENRSNLAMKLVSNGKLTPTASSKRKCS